MAALTRLACLARSLILILLTRHIVAQRQSSMHSIERLNVGALWPGVRAVEKCTTRVLCLPNTNRQITLETEWLGC
jgi:hypothetical protein